MPTENELIKTYKKAADAAQAAMVRFLGECFTETLLVREHVASNALAAHLAAKLEKDENASELRAVIILEFLKTWVESEADKIARARKSRFSEKREGSEIYDEARVSLRNREAEETRKKVEAWKAAENSRHNGPWPGRARDAGTGSPMEFQAAAFKA